MRGRRSTRRSNAMAHMGIVISKESWAVLREEPLYSARFIDREGAEELALVVRVEELDSFLEAHPPLPLALTAWRSPQGTWVVALAYQLHPTFGEAKARGFLPQPAPGRRRGDPAQAPAAGELVRDLLERG